jgi:hypothetical protein
MGERMVVQFARGARKREENPSFHERQAPRPRRTLFRMSITGLPVETSWQVSIPLTHLESSVEPRQHLPSFEYDPPTTCCINSVPSWSVLDLWTTVDSWHSRTYGLTIGF